VQSARGTTAGAGASNQEPTVSQPGPILRMYLKEIQGVWVEDGYVVWQASFSVILGDAEYELENEELSEVYFGMPRQFYSKNGNNRKELQSIPLYYQGLPSKKDDGDWNIGVFTDNFRQYYHRGRYLDDSKGCWVASCYPYKVSETLTPTNGKPFVVKTYNTSGTDEFSSIQSHQILKDILELYIKIYKQSPNLTFEAYFGAEAKTNEFMLEYLAAFKKITPYIN
jgi:hypothetical protein